MKKTILFAFLILCINVLTVDNFAGNCPDFDGVNDYINLGNPASLNLQSFTLETWFNRTGDGVTVGTGAGGIAAEPLITRGRGASDGNYLDLNYFMGIRGNPKVLVADFEDMFDGTNHPIIGTTVIEDNKWYHAVAAYDGTTWSLYLNGNLEAQSTEDATPRYDCIQYNAVGTTLNSTEVPSGYFKGWIDEASIWNAARTPADIQNSMHSTLAGTETNLVSYWQFNESGGTAASDHVSANNGTLHNMDDDDWITSSAPIFTGSGTEADPYWISNLDELGWLSGNSAYWDDSYIQTADIDASDTQYWNSGAGFSAIGIDSDSPFSGNYNGQDYTIDALYIDRSATDYIGLFGFTDYAEISDLNLTNVDITGYYNVGGLVGLHKDSVITNCSCTGNVSGHYDVGGLVGRSKSVSSIINSSGSVSVNGNNLVGGLVGQIYRGPSVSNCFCTGNVSGQDKIGGLVGLADGSADITNSYSTGSVSGEDHVGGFLGYLSTERAGTNDYSTGSVSGDYDLDDSVRNNFRAITIINCYSKGSVDGINNLGGFIGGAGSTAEVQNCFWDIETSGQADSGGGTGKTTAEMKDVATFTDTTTAGLDEAWDFVGNPNDDTENDDYWNITELRFNDGYPFLSWQYSPLAPGIPQNITISVSLSEVTINWDPAANATSYKVYSSADPYSGFEEDESGIYSGVSWSAPVPTGKKFYYVTALN